MEFIRDINHSKKIIILDGLTGTGKTMLTPILSKLYSVQNPRFEYSLEYIILATYFKKIDLQTSSAILNLIVDWKNYDGYISREINFRPSDLSSVFSSSRFLEYFFKLFNKDGSFIEDKIKNDSEHPCFATHQIIPAFEVIKEAFKDRLIFIESVRHPLFLVAHWESYIENHGTNSRDFTLWIKNKSKHVPWFVNHDVEKYNHFNSTEKSIVSICNLMSHVYKNIKSEILFIPFEHFVLDPNRYIDKIKEISNLDIKQNHLNKIYKKQKIPRKHILDGPNKKIYQRYSFDTTQANKSMKKNYAELMNQIQGSVSEDIYKNFTEICEQYEDIFEYKV